MAALVCDLCGGKLIMGSGGIATCDSCGMEHTADRMKEKIQEIKGTVKVDNSHLIDNYLEMATNAYGADNNTEAESYCNKIIEIDPTNYRAWFLKGKAAGWQSTLKNSRLTESVSAFAKAIINAPSEVKKDIIDESKEQVKNLATAMIKLRGNQFAKWPDEEETNGFKSDIASILKTLLQFINQAGVIIPLSELMAPMATTINQSVVKAFNDVIFPDYNGDPNDPDDRANKYDWQRYIDRINHCTTLVEQAIKLCDEDDESDIQRYENLIFLHEKAIDSCSWDLSYNASTGSNVWRKQWSLNDEAKAYRKKLIKEYKAKIKGIKAAEQKKAENAKNQRITSFWNRYIDEHQFLAAELEKSEKEREELTKAQTGYARLPLIDQHISEVKKILQKDRTESEKIQKGDKDFIDNSKAFWEKIASHAEYDSYLDQNPILKQTRELEQRRQALLLEQNKKLVAEKPDALLPCSLLPFISLFLLFIGILGEMTFAIVLGAIFLIIGTVGTCVYLKQYNDSKKAIRQKELTRQKDVREFNATIDKMLAVPKYTGTADFDVAITIPTKIN